MTRTKSSSLEQQPRVLMPSRCPRGKGRVSRQFPRDSELFFFNPIVKTVALNLRWLKPVNYDKPGTWIKIQILFGLASQYGFDI